MMLALLPRRSLTASTRRRNGVFLQLSRSLAATQSSGCSSTKTDSTNAIPHVDITFLFANRWRKLTTPNELATQQAILDAMKQACLHTGFFTIPTTKIVNPELIQKAYEHNQAFSNLPTEVKQKYHLKKVANKRGWNPLSESHPTLAGVATDLEGFDFARELPKNFTRRYSTLGPNVWPTCEIPSFQHDVYELYEEMTKVSNLLFQTFAEMLALDPTTFSQHVSEEAHARMRLLNYPPMLGAPQRINQEVPGDVGVMCQTAKEAFTILHQNGEGLQLLNRRGSWINAPSQPDRFIVLIGDVMENWTNGLLKATKHRIVNTTKPRQAIVRLNGVNCSAQVEPLPPFVSATNPPKYSPIEPRKPMQPKPQNNSPQIPFQTVSSLSSNTPATPDALKEIRQPFAKFFEKLLGMRVI